MLSFSLHNKQTAEAIGSDQVIIKQGLNKTIIYFSAKTNYENQDHYFTPDCLPDICFCL